MLPLRPDSLEGALLDGHLPTMGGLEATRCSVADEQLASVRVSVLTTFDLGESVEDGPRVAMGGFHLKASERISSQTIGAGQCTRLLAVTRSCQHVRRDS